MWSSTQKRDPSVNLTGLFSPVRLPQDDIDREVFLTTCDSELHTQLDLKFPRKYDGFIGDALGSHGMVGKLWKHYLII
jgi:hypothetical protein